MSSIASPLVRSIAGLQGLGRRAPLWSVAVALAVAALVLTPVISLARIALLGSEVWRRLVTDVLPIALFETSALLAGVAVLAGGVGIGTAWLVTAHEFPLRRTLAWLLPLPLAVPTYITAYIYVELLDAGGSVQNALRAATGWSVRDYWFPEIRSLGGCIFVMSAVLYPYIYLTARTMFLTQSACMMEVARTLGAGRLELFRTVALPLARPALAVGLSLALLEALNDIGASEFLGVRTLTVSVYVTWLNRGSLPGAAQIACAMLIIVLALIWLERRGRSDRRYALSTRRPRVAQPIPLPRRSGVLAAIACALPVLLGFAIPLGFLISETIGRGLIAQADRSFVDALVTTLGLSFAATAAVLALGIVVVTAARLSRSGPMQAAKSIAGIGYALPGAVLALGLMGPLVGVDTVLNGLWSLVSGDRLGLVLMGSAGGVVVAYAIRFLPIAVGSLSAGLDRVSAGVEDAARTLGARSRELVLRVQLPLLRPALASAALLVFVDCLKELPATLLLRPVGAETLATAVYGAAVRGVFEEGALAALVIVAVGVWPVIRLTGAAEARARSRSGS